MCPFLGINIGSTFSWFITGNRPFCITKHFAQTCCFFIERHESDFIIVHLSLIHVHLISLHVKFYPLVAFFVFAYERIQAL